MKWVEKLNIPPKQIKKFIKKKCPYDVFRYGPKAPSEECAELINAVQKHRRGRNTKEDVLDEVADVYIMLEQLTLIITEGEQIKPHSVCDEKLERLKGRLYEKT